MGTTNRLGIGSMREFFSALGRVRGARPSVSIDLVGDMRERSIARLTGAKRHLHLGWEQTHPFSRITRNPWGKGRPSLLIDSTETSIYRAHEAFLDLLAPSPTTERNDASPVRQAGKPICVGLHPFASQQCKLWPMANWQGLARRLLDDGCELVAFGAPNERRQLVDVFDCLIPSTRLLTGSLEEFTTAVTGLDLMIGLDSFSVHMADSLGVPSVMINAGNPPELWSPPIGQTVHSSGGCPSYPCYNVPTCEGSLREYACVRSVDVTSVLNAAHSLLHTIRPRTGIVVQDGGRQDAGG